MSILTAIIADNPDHYWRFADPGGALAADIGGGTRVPLQAAQTGSFPYSGPSSDGGSAFVTSSLFFRQDNAFLALTNFFSVELWFWFYASGVGDQSVAGWQGLGGGARQAIRYQNAGTLLYFLSGDGTVTSASSPSPRAWHQVVVTYDHVTQRMYVDGALSASNPTVVTTAGNYQLLIGDEWTGTPALGFVSEAAIWLSTVLTPTQVSNHFNGADRLTQAPFFKGSGAGPLVNGNGTFDSDLLEQIYAAVHKVY